MTAALLGAFADLRDARVRGMAAAVVLWTAGVFAAVLAAALAAVGIVDFGEGSSAPALRVVAGVLVAAAVLALSWLFFVVVVQNVAAFYLDRVVARVEAVDYPDLPAAPGLPTREAVAASFRFTLLLVAANVAAAPFYAAGLLVPPVGLAAFCVVNGWLVGREYADVVALRRLSPDEARNWRRSRRWTVFLAGLIVTLGLTVPVLNLLVPVIGAAFMTHLFHGRTEEAAADPPPE